MQCLCSCSLKFLIDWLIEGKRMNNEEKTNCYLTCTPVCVDLSEEFGKSTAETNFEFLMGLPSFSIASGTILFHWNLTHRSDCTSYSTQTFAQSSATSNAEWTTTCQRLRPNNENKLVTEYVFHSGMGDHKLARKKILNTSNTQVRRQRRCSCVCRQISPTFPGPKPRKKFCLAWPSQKTHTSQVSWSTELVCQPFGGVT